MNNLTRIHHVAIICSDYQVSKNFYINILGLSIIQETYREDRKSYKLDVRVGECDQIELFSFPEAPDRLTYPEARGLRHLAFATNNIEEDILNLRNKGIDCEPVRIDEQTGKKYTFFVDPDGLPLELYEDN